MIVKVVMPASASDAPVIHDEKKTVFMHPTLAMARRRMARESVGYFHATIQDGILELGERAPGQSW